MATGIKQLARFAKVSPATVSKALSGGQGVKAETRQRIVELAKRLDYQPSGLGRSLVRGQTDYIGLDYQQGAMPAGTMQGMLQSVEDRVRQRGYALMVITRLPDDTKVPRIVRQRIVDGVIVAHVRDAAVESFARSAGLAHVLLNVASTSGCDCVYTDNENGSRLAVRHLVELGHRRIAFVNSMYSNVHASQAERAIGYMRAISEAGLVVIPGADDVMPVEQNINRYLELDDPPTAFLCFNDLIAIQAMHYLKRRGLRVPRDISVIGCDDNQEIVQYLDPPLTTLRLPLEKMGDGAARLVLDRLDTPSDKPRSLIFEQELIVRESTSSPNT